MDKSKTKSANVKSSNTSATKAKDNKRQQFSESLFKKATGYYLEKRYHEAFVRYKLSANLGNPQAWWMLGVIYLEGDGCVRNETKGIEFLYRAVADNEPHACYDLALYYIRTGVNTEKAIALLQQSADLGNGNAAYKLGEMIAKGENGLKQDFKNAVEYLTKAVDAGVDNAYIPLSMIYYGVKKNVGHAIALLKRCTDSSNRDLVALAANVLGDIYRCGEDDSIIDLVESVRWFTKAAEAGDADGMYALSVHYERGDGVTQDETEAMLWLRRAADAGHAKAQRRLGEAFYWGDGVPKDLDLAFKWCLAAAQQGDAEAQYCVGLGYIKGEGTAVDEELATKYFRLAAEQGYVNAYIDIAKLLLKKSASSEALTWLKKGADAGDAECEYGLGLIYESGYGGGVEPDVEQALFWYSNAAEKGHKKAAEILSEYK